MHKLALIVSWIFFAGCVVGFAVAQSSRGPSNLPGCIYNSSAPTLSTGQTVSLQCDINGKLKVNTS